MRNTRTASRLLALVLTVLMLASCFVALPAMAEEAAAKSEKKPLWDFDFDDAGTVYNGVATITGDDKTKATIRPNATDDAKYPNGYLVDSNAFYFVSSRNYAGTDFSDSSYITSGRDSGAYKGLLSVGGNTLITDQITTNDKRDFYDLLHGIYGKQVSGETRPTQTSDLSAVGSSYFWEFDFLQKKSSIIKDTSAKYTLSGGTETTPTAIFCENALVQSSSGGAFFQMYGGTKNVSQHLFYITNEGYISAMYPVDENGNRGSEKVFTTIATTSSGTEVPADNLVYVLDGNGQPEYLPKGTVVKNAGWYYMTDEKAANCYQIEYNKQYRIGVELQVLSIETGANAGRIRMRATCYIKTEGAENWEACIGATDYYYCDTDYSGTNSTPEAVYRMIKTADNTDYLAFGGYTEIYQYTCDGTNHLNVVETPDASNASISTHRCIDCGETWMERELDGLLYKKDSETSDTCEGISYTTWVPMNGVGVPFTEKVYSSTAPGHKYDDTKGYCSVCKSYEWVDGTLPEGTVISNTRSESGRKQLANYAADANGNGYLARSDGSTLFPEVKNKGGATVSSNTFMMYHEATEGGETVYGFSGAKPYLLSFDFKLLGNIAGSSSSSQHADFLSATTEYNEGSPTSNNVTVVDTLLRIGLTADGKSILILDDDCTDGAGGESIYDLTLNEWVNIQLVVIPYTTSTSTLMVYVNGEHVGTRISGFTHYNSGKGYTAKVLRFGTGSVRKNAIAWGVDNIGLKFLTDADIANWDLGGQDQLFELAFDRHQWNTDIMGTKTTVLGASDPDWGSDDTQEILALGTNDEGEALVTTYGGHSKFMHYVDSDTSSNWLDFSLTQGTNHVINGKKYVMEAELAFNSAVEQKNLVVFQLRKGADANRVYLVYLSSSLQYCAYELTASTADDGTTTYSRTTRYLVDKDGNPLKADATFTNGVPDRWSKVAAVVDETTNTFSVYVNDTLAYYKSGDDLIPAADLSMAVEAGTGGTYTNTPFSSLSGSTYKYHFLRFAQNAKDFALSELSVSLIHDSEVELVGAQESEPYEDANGDTVFDVRFLAGVDDLYVSGVGFRVEAYVDGVSQGTVNHDLDHVFSAVRVGSGTNVKTVRACSYDAGAYFAAVEVAGIPYNVNDVKTYTFKVTPFTKAGDGKIAAEWDSWTVVYNSKGECLSTGVYTQESVTSPDVILRTTANSPDGKYSTFYIYVRTSDPSGQYYVRYNYVYEYNTDWDNDATQENISSYRLRGAQLTRVTGYSDTAVEYHDEMDVLATGEFSLAILEFVPKEAGATNSQKNTSVGDFIGGYHGDEHMTSFKIKADGTDVSVDGTKAEVIPCTKLTIEQVSKLDRWSTDEEKEAVIEHTQNITVNKDGFVTDRKVKWLVSDYEVVGTQSFLAMFTMVRNDSGTAVCRTVETLDAAGNRLGKETFELSNTTEEGSALQNKATRMVRYSDAESGVSAVTSIENISGAKVSTSRIAYRVDDAKDNKWYVSFVPATPANEDAPYTPAQDEVWSLTTRFHVDYNNPNN